MQPQPRRLPFDREDPGAWQRWEHFWVDFLNASPLLPWPGKPTTFKRVMLAEKYGVLGGRQDGIDVRAEMDDGSILAVQCKDWLRFAPTEAKTAMDKAEREYPGANAYLLVLTQPDVPRNVELGAGSRSKPWRVVGRDALSSWFFAGKLVEAEHQKRLVRQHFGPARLKSLFPLSDDDLLISPEAFFSKKGLIRQDLSLRGKATQELAARLVETLSGSGLRVATLVAAGGQGKTRMLKEVAKGLQERHPERRVLFLNEDAPPDAEDYELRGMVPDERVIFIDDAHRLENVRKRFLKHVAAGGKSSLVIATRPNGVESLKRRLVDAGFEDDECAEFRVPALDWQGRHALAVEILGRDDGKTPALLATQSEGCTLICTVGAELIRKRKLTADVALSDDFKREVFDHLVESSLETSFGDEREERRVAEDVLRVIAMAGPVARSRDEFGRIGRWIARSDVEVGRVVPRLEESGLLRLTRRVMKVVPDLLADHLVYDTAYGKGRNEGLVGRLVREKEGRSLAILFGNLAEAEWRASQEGKVDVFLEDMWGEVRRSLKSPDDDRVFGILAVWKKIAVFQPRRTLELARLVLDEEARRVVEGRPAILYDGGRYDSLALHLAALPELLAPVVASHPAERMDALDLLRELGANLMTADTWDLPEASKVVVRAARFSNWAESVPQDVFAWFQDRVVAGEMTAREAAVFLRELSESWFNSAGFRSMRDVGAIREHAAGIHGFRMAVLAWIGDALVSRDAAICWAVLPMVKRAGLVGCLEPSKLAWHGLDLGKAGELVSVCQRIVGKILELQDDPVIRLSIWQFLSLRLAFEEDETRVLEWKRLRDGIKRDTAFELARLASSFAAVEWRHERLIRRERRKDDDEATEWWPRHAAQLARNMRDECPGISERLAKIGEVGAALDRLDQRSSWDVFAHAWSISFPEEREAIVEELFADPAHTLVPAVGYFLGEFDAGQVCFVERLFLRGLAHDDVRILEAVLARLSWRRSGRSEAVATALRSRAATGGPEVQSALVGFLRSDQFQPGPYFDEVLASLKAGDLPDPALAGLSEAIAHAIEYGGRSFDDETLDGFFNRLIDVPDLNKTIPDDPLSVLLDAFPRRMFEICLKRVRKGRDLPWSFEDWSFPGLGDSADLEIIARELAEEAVHAEEDRFHLFRELFDRAVRRADPALAGRILMDGLNRFPLPKIVDLTGVGQGSVMYDSPDLALALIDRIRALPAAEARDLRSRLVWLATPHSWGTVDGEVRSAYRWARDLAAAKEEEYRSEPLLREFFSEVRKDQDALFENERARCLEDDG